MKLPDTPDPILNPALKVGAVTGPSFHSLGACIKHRSHAYFFYTAKQERRAWW